MATENLRSLQVYELRGRHPGLEWAQRTGLGPSWRTDATDPPWRSHKAMETEMGTRGQSRGCRHHQRLEETGRVPWAAQHGDTLTSEAWNPEKEFPLWGLLRTVGDAPTPGCREEDVRTSPGVPVLEGTPPFLPSALWGARRLGQHLQGWGTQESDEEVASSLGCPPPELPGTWGSESWAPWLVGRHPGCSRERGLAYLVLPSLAETLLEERRQGGVHTPSPGCPREARHPGRVCCWGQGSCRLPLGCWPGVTVVRMLGLGGRQCRSPSTLCCPEQGPTGGLAG